jgi:hypothetical protein
MAYIGIDRGIEDHWIYQDAEYFKVWFEILLRSRYSKEPEKKLIDGKFVTIEYGQFLFGRISWSDRLKVSEQRMRTLFKKLIDDDMIELIYKFPKFSLYSVKNYAKYNQQSNQQKDDTEQGIKDNANQQSNGTPTSSQPAANQQLTTQEESKERKKVKPEVIKTLYAEQVSLSEDEYFKLIEKYGSEESVKWAIEKLSNYKCSKTTKYKSDYHVLIGWVFEEFEKKRLFVVNGGQARGKVSSISKIQELYNKALEDEQREANGGY